MTVSGVSSGVKLLFAHDTTAALVLAADLVNTAPGAGAPAEAIPDADALEKFLAEHQVVPRRGALPADVAPVRALRSRLLAGWEAAGTAPSKETAIPRLAAVINELLDDSDARPWLVDHGGGWGWHLHVTKPDAPLVHRIAAQAAFAFADLVRLGETERLRRCAAPSCQAVLVDLSRNRSRLYCDTGNCGNRQHVAAYRARQLRARSAPADGVGRTDRAG
jgi:predicted RNA-binding Zn ribbon-like protein